MFIDTHSHINSSAFKNDSIEVINKSLESNIWMILVGFEHKTSLRALNYANKYDKGVYSSVGLHPIHLESFKIKEEEASFKTVKEEFNYEVYEKLAKSDKVVAIGEIGLDYYHIEKSRKKEDIIKKQKDVFIKQLILALKLKLPVIIHCRDADQDMYEILSSFKKEYKNKLPKDKPWGVMHCFSGSEDLAWKYFSLGLIISFTGIITFSKEWDDLIRKMPDDRFMIETDCPFLSPVPHRGKRNEPIFVEYIAKRIAEIRNTSLEKIANITTSNARNFFNI